MSDPYARYTRLRFDRFLGFGGPEVKQAPAVHLQKRKPCFPPDAVVG